MANHPLPTALSISAGGLYPYSESLMLTGERKSRFGDDFHLFRVQGGAADRRILVPRGIVPAYAQDLRSDGKDASFMSSFVPRNSEQARVVDECVHLLLQGENFIAECPTGFGKCHGKDTPVIMADGSVKMVQDVVAGDCLMGDDSTPRKVLSTTVGYGDLFLVTPNNGDSFVCNDVHVLSLKSSCSEGQKYVRGVPVNIPLNEYLQSSATFRHRMKLWKVGVEFPSNYKLPLDPYFLGALLGDGSFSSPSVGLTTMDQELVDEVYHQATLFGLKVRAETQEGNLSSTYYLSQVGGNVPHGNQLISVLRRLRLWGCNCSSKFIPRLYLLSSRASRLALLAGLIDTDGFHIKNCYEVTFKGEQLHNDLVFLARSLGFAVSRGVKVVNGVSYFRAFISGDTSSIPVRLARKKASIRKQKKDALLSGFSVSYLGKGDYYGFTLDGNSLYLLGDFTVTHNTACATDIISQVGKKVLIVVTKEDIRDQWVEAAHKFLGLPGHRIGLIQGDRFEVSGRDFVVAMVQSLAKESRYPLAPLREFGFAIWDEVHRVGSDYFSLSCYRVPARLRLGLSATPDRKDGREIVIAAHIGPVRVKSEAAPSTPRVITRISPWKVPMTKITDKKTGQCHIGPIPHTPGRCGHIINMMVKSHARNTLMAKFIRVALGAGRHVLFQSDRTDHLDTMASLVHGRGFSPVHTGFYAQGLSKAEREAVKKKQFILATYQMTAEATDIPRLDTLVMGTPKSDVRQIVGRILRLHPDKADPLVLDLVDYSSNVFTSYWNSRREWYESIGVDVPVPVEEADYE